MRRLSTLSSMMVSTLSRIIHSRTISKICPARVSELLHFYRLARVGA
jgi:hypothetical protein